VPLRRGVRDDVAEPAPAAGPLETEAPELVA
jgi:hypothetical protein